MRATRFKLKIQDSRFPPQRVACGDKIQDKGIKNPVTCNLQLVTCNSRRAGFTLLEIMIALAIVGATLIIILHTVNYHADVSYDHTLTTQIVLFAKEKIADMELNPKDEKGVSPDKNFSYETTVKNTDDEGVIELKTLVRGYGKEVVLSELIVKKQP